MITNFEIVGPYLAALMMSLGALCIFIWGVFSGALIGGDDAAKRFFAANSLDTELDAAGRVGVPSFLLEHAGLSKEVVVTGSHDALEIWDRATWAEYNAALASDVHDITTSLGHTA